MLLPLTNSQRCARFGAFSFRHSPQPSNYEHITILRSWALSNIVEVEIPQLRVLFGVTRVNVHYKAADSLKALWKAWDANGYLRMIHSWNGSFVPRYKRGKAPPHAEPYELQEVHPASAALSNHSWGTAFDINARYYPLGTSIDVTDPFCQLFADAEALGWFPGAKFRSRPDPMHFEYVGKP